MLTVHFAAQSQQLYFENFDDEANGATSGTATGSAPLAQRGWSVTTTPSGGAGSFSKQTYSVKQICFPFNIELFQINQSGTEGVWASSVVDISATGQAALSISLGSGTTVASNYVRAYYRLNGGPEILFGELYGGTINLGSVSSIILTGSTVQVIVRGNENTGGNRSVCFQSELNAMGFDDVEITGIQTLYSVNSGPAPWDWDEGSSWSLTDGGAACGCTPNENTNVVVRTGNTITIPSIGGNAEVAGVTVRSGGSLSFSADEVLNVNKGGSINVAAGGALSSGAFNASSIQLDWSATNSIVVDGALTIGDFNVSAAATVNMSGIGAFTVMDDFSVTDAATVTNNLTGTIAILDAMSITGGGPSFTNNGPITVTGVTTVNAPTIFTNNNTVTMSSQSAAVLAGTGTWTQGNNATLNYAGNTLTITTFNASNTGNTVNYNRTRGATIRNPTANTYYHLSIDGTLSGAKTSSANHIVDGNLSITGNATTLDPLNFDFTVNGTTSITVTGGGFNDSNDAGINTFIGNVSVGAGASFVSTSVSTTGNLVFRGGIANAGTFTAGGATFNTNAQALTGTTAMAFANNVSISGVTVTNSNTAAFTVTGTTTLTNGGYTDTSNSGISTFVGLVSQSGTSAFNTTSVTSESNLVFRGGITNNGGTFTAGGATFNTNAQIIAGANAISFANLVVVNGVAVTNNNTSGVSITSTGTSLSGTGAWTQGTNGILNFGGSSLTVTTFDANTNAGNIVNYNASTIAQNIRVPSSASTYRNLRFNNTFGTAPQLTAEGNVTVSEVLTMTAGRVNLNSNTITLSSSAVGALVHGLTSVNGWMYGGSLRRTFAASTPIAAANVRGAFPLGSASDWRPFFVWVSTNPGTAGTITVSHTNSTTTSDVSILDPNAANTIVKRHDSFWSVATATISGGNWAIRAGGDNFGVIAAGAGDIRMATSTGVVGTHAAGSGGPSDWRVNRTDLTFGALTNNFHVASTNGTTSPLPVHLTFFNAKLNNDQVELTWETASELDNDFFTIEKTSDLESFEEVVKRDGQGTTHNVHRYSAVDYYPYFGRSYYRLRQTDFDGKYTFSNIQVIDYTGTSMASLHAYPSPSEGKRIVIEVRGLEGVNSVPVQIINMKGQRILEQTFEVKTPGLFKEELELSTPLPAGVYIIKAGPTLLLTQKIVVE